ncbi:Neuroligin-1 [Orchesella cincta]|uniref:Neuroligin-1 n=1 Tax=Orchesella cincta TaxID=48709 RepID=A0A1D2N0B0_ORCCI|nr:Neuroligin-1 [Orchesella cincta]
MSDYTFAFILFVIDPVNAYLGIPYASPPVNAYRFMPPVAPLPWGGTRLAVALPPACPQKFPDISNRTKVLQTMTLQRYQLIQKLIPNLANQSEDCLYLNVYVPTVPSGEEIRPGKFAIVLIIHGESWDWGSGNEFDGGALASLGNHIVVTFNFRLGILGFLKTSNQQSNFGLLDVIAALHWVRENGDSFGGDRNRICLLGYRTGAVIANLLLVAQIAKGLFHRSLLIGGSVLSPWALQRRPEDIASQVSAHLGCVGRLPLSHPESDLAPCLRRKHLSDLLNFVPDSPRFLPPFAPFVDNILIRNPKSMMEGELSEQFLRSQILFMFTTSEGVHELSSAELKNGFESDHRDRILRTLVRNVFTFHQQEIFSIVRNEYTDWERPILHPIPLKDSTVEALSDCLVVGPALQVALIHSRRKGKTYVLHFSHVHTSKMDSDHSPYKVRSLEGDIVPYVMGLPVTNNVPALGGQHYVSPWSSLANFSKQDSVVSETLVHYISNFIKSGTPSQSRNLHGSVAISTHSIYYFRFRTMTSSRPPNLCLASH